MSQLEQTRRNTLQWNRLEHAVVATSALAILGLMIWGGQVAWQFYPCRETAINLITGDPSCPPLLLDLAALIIALSFWAAGMVVWFTGHRGSTIWFFFLGAGVLAAGKLSSMNSETGGRLFYVLLAWLSPCFLQFHIKLLDRPPGRSNRAALGGMYALAGIWSLPFLLWTIASLQQSGWFIALRLGVRLTFVVSVVVAVVILIGDYHRRAAPIVRRRIRLIFFGTFLAFAPLILFYLLPDALGLPEVRWEWTLPGLLIVPLTYVYSLLHGRLIRVEAALRRVLAYYLIITLVLGVYLATLGTLTAIATDMTVLLEQVGLGLLLCVGLLLIFAPLRQGIDHLTNWIWYGRSISHLSLLERLVESLPTTLDRETLRRLLLEELAAAMHLSKSALLLKDQDDRLTLLGCVGFDLRNIAACQWPGDSQLTTYLQAAAEPVTHDQVHRTLARAAHYPGEQVWLSRSDVAFWLPLVSAGTLQGLLLIGSRQESDPFTAADQHILATLARQSGVAAHNVRLMEQVQVWQQDLARAHQQLMVGREQERRRLAHDLHDGTVQQLIGISYQLAEGRRSASNGSDADAAQRFEEIASTLEIIRQEVLGVVSQLRSLIGELRPAGLEELGLVTALEGYVAHLRRDGGTGIEIHLDLDESEFAIQDSIAICLFRVAQEALRNALKHAHAHYITVSLRQLTDTVILCVQDDGCGFQVPPRLSQLTQTGHFGLAGMSERVTWAGGQLSICSQPGTGTEVQVEIPLNGGV
jgi:signal transduction histidine kinase